MANPQKENGYTPIANEIIDEVAKMPFTATQLKIILVCWRYTYGFSRKVAELSEGFISKTTGISSRYISQALKSLIDANVITVVQEATYTSPRILAFNKNYELWGCRSTVQQVKYSSTGEVQFITDTEPAQKADERQGCGSIVQQMKYSSTDEVQFNQDKQLININNNIYSLFMYWNSKNIIVHRKLTDKIKRKISGSLKTYKIDELKKAIDNYHTILTGKEYYWSYKWTLEDFLQRGVEKFLTDACFENYKTNKITESPQPKPPKYRDMTNYWPGG